MLLTPNVSPSSLNAARLSFTPYMIGLAPSTTRVRRNVPTTSGLAGLLLLTPLVNPNCITKSLVFTDVMSKPPLVTNSFRCCSPS